MSHQTIAQRNIGNAMLWLVVFKRNLKGPTIREATKSLPIIPLWAIGQNALPRVVVLLLLIQMGVVIFLYIHY